MDLFALIKNIKRKKHPRIGASNKMEIQKLKKLAKSVPFIKTLAEKNNKRKKKNRVSQSIDTYKERYLDYSVSLRNSGDIELLRRTIVIDSHIIEKGVSHSNFRAGFGKAVIIELQDCIKKYLDIGGQDDFVYRNAISLLYEYHKLNEQNGFDDSDYFQLRFVGNSDLPDLAPYCISSTGEGYNPDYENLMMRRHSVRKYDGEVLPISTELFQKIVSLANTAPSACNRQATHVYAVTDKLKFKAIEELQRGCKGFGEHVSAFLFIASDLSLYTVDEFKLPIFDAGIFTMNLLYALEAYGLYSCTLNASFYGENMIKIREIASIPDSYEVNGLVAVYNLAKDEKMSIASSPRRKADDLLTVL